MRLLTISEESESMSRKDRRSSIPVAGIGAIRVVLRFGRSLGDYPRGSRSETRSKDVFAIGGFGVLRDPVIGDERVRSFLRIGGKLDGPFERRKSRYSPMKIDKGSRELTSPDPIGTKVGALEIGGMHPRKTVSKKCVQFFLCSGTDFRHSLASA
jgi:hypothetical protein